MNERFILAARANVHEAYLTTKTLRHKGAQRFHGALVPLCLGGLLVLVSLRAFVVRVSNAHKGLYYLAAFLAVLVIAGGVALAQTGGPYNLEWHSFDGGGGQMAGGAYSLSGTVGQADAGAVMSGGSYSLSGGFWGGAASQSTIYSPLVLRNSAGS
ncbi:MAG: hypothetical protein ACUVWR_18755 [Anaerolineae bacterium]